MGRSTLSAAGVVRGLGHVRPVNRAQLRGWLRAVLGIEAPSGGVCGGHGGPLDYVEAAFFERLPARPRPDGEDAAGADLVVWANRGGGKTFYGAVATLLDLLFKPGIAIRILGGSRDQSRRMYEYLRWMLDRDGLRERIAGRMTERGVALDNGSRVELLAQVETSVRGQRVQKLRCDEVELFKPEVWSAAQFVTRSKRCGDVEVRGSIEALSTMHRPHGLMQRLVEEADPAGRVMRWCALDVMARCTLERACETCALWASCGGRARAGRGFVSPRDVLDQQRRSSAAAFEAEMLCRRPSRADAVYAEFDPEVHVRAVEREAALRWVGGMDFGLRSPFVMLWAQVRPLGGRERLEVLDEYVQRGRTVEQHLRAMGERGWARPAWVGVDPAGHQRSEQTGVSTIALLRRAGLRVRSARATLASGLEAVRQRLSPADGSAGPLLWIHPRCERLIEALGAYHFDPARPDRRTPVKDGPDHAADALRYLVVNQARGGGEVEVRDY